MVLFIFGDITFLLVVVLLLGLSSAVMIVQWLLEHLVLIGVILALKSVLLLGRDLLDRRDNVAVIILTIVWDVFRSVIFLWVAAGILSELFDSSVFFLERFFNIVIGVPLALLAAEWPVCHLYEEGPGDFGWWGVLVELASIGELLLVKLIT